MIINYSDLDMKTMHTISTAVSQRLSAGLGRTVDADTITGILLRFEVSVEITADGGFLLCRDRKLEGAVKHLCASVYHPETQPAEGEQNVKLQTLARRSFSEGGSNPKHQTLARRSFSEGGSNPES